ncbi:MAG: hypothetical protein ACLQLC_01005 [Candidatus Sulfotelmatobacter sp.]
MSAQEPEPHPSTGFTARLSCSLPRVFNSLASQVERDVATRNSLRPPNSPYEFSLAEDNGALTVHLNTKKLRRSVTFKLSLPDHAILVSDETGNRLFDVTSSLDDNGRCMLMVNGEERDPWQVRRMALEDLMFSGL